MKDKNEILINIFRKRLKDYELPVEKDVWASIEKDLTPIPHTFRKVIFWRYAGIAASVLVIFGLGVFFFQNQEKIAPQVAKNSTISTIPEKSSSKTLDLMASNNVEEKQPDKTSSAYTRKIDKNPAKATENQAFESTPEVTISDQPVKKSNTEKANDTKNQEKVESKSSTPKKDFYQTDDELWFPDEKKQQSNKGISYALLVGNSMSDNNKNLHKEGIYADGEYAALPPFNYGSTEPSYLSVDKTINDLEQIEPEYKFNLPISVGFIVRKHISDELAIESGLVYTYLSSKETTRTTYNVELQVKDISLNYLGIPAKLVYSFYNSNRLSIYAAGGGMVEKSVYGKEKINVNIISSTKELDIPELQWSISGSLGINYRIFKRLGIFLEPGVSHYFDDGSSVMTIRKDTPTNFTLQGGIRLSY